jgi:hypothetical protein
VSKEEERGFAKKKQDGLLSALRKVRKEAAEFRSALAPAEGKFLRILFG